MANSVTVSDIKSSADYASSAMVENANNFLADLRAIADLVKPDSNNWNYTSEAGIDLVDPTVANAIVAAAANSPSEPAMPVNGAERPSDASIAQISVPEFGAIPEMVLVEPVLSIPSPPSAALPTAPGNAPELNSAVLPAAPQITLPAPPTIQALALPEAPAINVPTFNATTPVDDMLEPSSRFEFREDQYQSDLLDAAKQKLISDLVNGGYGIETADEEALWDRARARELLNAETQIQEAARQAAARGMMLPPGALNATISRIQTTALEKTSSLSRDIALKRADMYVENRRFTLQEVRQVEAMLIQYFGFVQERALNASRYLAEFGVQLLNAKLARFNARLEAFRGAAQVYETQLRGALAHLDVYKSKVEGARLSVEAQQMYVSLYNAQLEGVKSRVELYRTQMEAAKVFTEVERSKLDLFRTRVEAYQAQVSAKAAEFGMYEARIRGEATKLGVYETSVRAYATKVQAYQTGVAAKETQVRAQVAAAQVPLEEYRAKIQMYGADVARYQADIQAALGIYDSRLKRYSVQVDAQVKAVAEKVQAQQSNSTVMAHRAQIASSEMLGQSQILNARSQIAATAASSGLGILSQNMAAIRTAAGGLVAEIQSA